MRKADWLIIKHEHSGPEVLTCPTKHFIPRLPSQPQSVKCMWNADFSMGDMLQSSSRVKLNRVALKDVIGVKIAPRRRKVQQPRADSKEEDKSVLEDSGCNKSPRDVLSYKKGAENGRASSIAAPGGKQEKRVGMHVEADPNGPEEAVYRTLRRFLGTRPSSAHRRTRKPPNMSRRTKVILAAPPPLRKSAKRCDLLNCRSVGCAGGRETPSARTAKSARGVFPPASAALRPLPHPPPASKMHLAAKYLLIFGFFGCKKKHFPQLYQIFLPIDTFISLLMFP